MSIVDDLYKDVLSWTFEDVLRYFENDCKLCPENGLDLLTYFQTIGLGNPNGLDVLLMREADILCLPTDQASLIWKKRLYHAIRRLQLTNINAIERLGYDPDYIISGRIISSNDDDKSQNLSEKRYTSRIPSTDGHATRLMPELWKTLISMLYLFIVTWITAFVMVIVHHRVPDMKKYPPLPDIFLDNVPHIPWAFAMCECTATLLLFIWICVLVVHKHRFILLRRFFALSGTVFLLRCITMLITSLSVPGSHLKCYPMAEELQANDTIWMKAQHAYTIWRGAGLSIQGVRTCGDYMFSGHTAALTILNFFITEYTPRHLYFMHTFSWMLNMFGIFFILSGHEHYSIDVFIAFYITSRLFLYYHTLANNQSLMQRDSQRTRIWFPLFSFFESEIDGIIPNEFETPSSLITMFFQFLKKYWAYLYSVSMRRTLRLRQD